MSRRGLFGLLAGDHTDAVVPSPEPAGEGAELVDAPPPWVARERARVLVQDARLVARITTFACIAASGCSVCSERCPEPDAIVLSRGRPVVQAARCTGCGACREACPAPLRAIELLPVLPGNT